MAGHEFLIFMFKRHDVQQVTTAGEVVCIVLSVNVSDIRIRILKLVMK